MARIIEPCVIAIIRGIFFELDVISSLYKIEAIEFTVDVQSKSNVCPLFQLDF
ncbi:hypothetical protein GHT06_016898 [Daphnia sinensis]|uniref:Uncharacterized protein n=1 Tax=Daphnia sinensis TaxID=1820382 RepID=A0AAD5PVK0_9CRUS|nr:hypothetical protein GHT06_016898 [Daphnia sinensis]